MLIGLAKNSPRRDLRPFTAYVAPPRLSRANAAVFSRREGRPAKPTPGKLASTEINGEKAMKAENLRNTLRYEPETGNFMWLVDAGGKKAGDIAGTNRNGYRCIAIDGKKYAAHRLAWLYMTGSLPSQTIDHKNRNCSDNRWENLRLADRQQQMFNRSVRKDCRSGLKGAQLSYGGKWCARISYCGKKLYLGLFDTPEAAHEAYKAKAAEFFGEFAAA